MILHGNGDQVLPIPGSASLSAKFVENRILKFYPGESRRTAFLPGAIFPSALVYAEMVSGTTWL